MRARAELLSPAGSVEAFYMALANGADAVYLGGKEFSARASATNFNRQELEEVVDFAHIRGKKVYVTLNILIADEEIDRALEYTDFLWTIGVDGLIVQDLGFSQLVRKNYPDFELHASTQMSILDYEGARFLEERGFSRVVVGRETSLDQIEKIHRKTGLEIEAFCHGALCVSLSGQCLMSSMLGGRSGNRGACAQPCRKQYDLVDAKGDSAYQRGYALSPRDLNTIDQIDKLLEVGVYSLKLEGRMKRPDYVGLLTRNYAQALEGAFYSQEDIAQTFNRTFTRGLALGEFSHDYISFDRPDNRGVPVGRAVKRLGKRIVIRAEKDLKKGDLLELPQVGGGFKTLSLARDLARGEEEAISINFKPLVPALVNRIISQDLVESSKDSLGQLFGQVPLKGIAKVKVGERLSLSLIGEREVRVQGPIVEKARKQGVDKRKLKENLGKFGQSYFFLGGLDLDLDEDAFVSLSQVNDLRRRGLALYEASYLKKQASRLGARQARVYGGLIRKRVNKAHKQERISVEVASLDLFKRLDLEMIDQVELNFYQGLDQALDDLKGYKGDVFLSLPTYEEGGSYKEFLRENEGRLKGVVVQSLGQVQDTLTSLERIAGQGLNIFNSESMEFFLNQGMDVVASAECNYSQLARFTNNFSSCGQVYVYGYQKVMTTKYCPMSLKKGCGSQRRCQSCSYRKGYSLLDGKKASFPFERRHDFTEIYNSVPTYLGGDLGEVKKLNPSVYKLRFRFDQEPVEDLVSAMFSYFRGAPGALDGIGEKLRETGFTRGHLRKGIIA